MKKVIYLFLVSILFLVSCKSKKDANKIVEVPCVENTNENCMCITQYDPVCGCNNKTYSNSCHAECSGVTYVKGACKGSK